MEHDGTPQREFNIFISYHHEDNHYKALTSIAKEAVKACNDDMGNVHFNCFLDENINPGTSWRTRINEALSRTDVLLPFITEDYCRSEECRYEFNLFFSKKHGNEFCLPVFWHAESVIAESLDSDVQDAKDVWQKVQSINGISDIANAVKQLPRYAWDDELSRNLRQFIVSSITGQLHRMAKILNKMSSAEAKDMRLSAQEIAQAEQLSEESASASGQSVSEPATVPSTTPARTATRNSDNAVTSQEPNEPSESDELTDSDAEVEQPLSPIFHMRTKNTGVDAKAQLIDGVFTLLQGSVIPAQANISDNNKAKYSAKTVKKLFEKYWEDGTLVPTDPAPNGSKMAMLVADIQFTSPSGASAFAQGHATAGNTVWQTDDGVAYKDWVNQAAAEAGETLSDENDEDDEDQKQSSNHSGKTPRAGSRKAKSKTDVSIKDTTTYDTIAQVCNTVFGTNYVSSPYKSHFQPGTLHNRVVTGYEPYRVMAWFPRITAEDGKPVIAPKDWSYELSHEGGDTYIYRTNKNGTTERSNKDEGTRNVVFGGFLDPENRKVYYRFLGVFRDDGVAVHNGKASYRSKLVADSFPIIKD
ncbi:hypothetical protein CSQ85_03775 [Bifidobacterium rousetti]|uniref:TIR domain-containing protein n=1 Tax=Bifidobacterium rousetti TaxID=2045439 RepID=UPI00168AE659|nr:TIR domain-containing protein [Bifidobacterium rousetti]KAA8819825.1 hypothetical protein CSQ85_03775 [Bifidobacterium rousetti]